MKKINLSNPHIEVLEPYMSARRIGGKGEVWLNANELPFPRQPMSLDVSDYHRYPDEGPDLVQAAYAEYAGLQPDQVLALRGADEAIDLLLRAYCQSGTDGVIISSPTYGMYQVCANIQNADVIDVPLTEDYQLDVPAILAQDGIKLVFICNPNNPTGNSFNREDILTILRFFEGRAVVVIDEAYIEFCSGETLTPEMANFENLVVVRTMSKAFGLAGVHVGYLLANETVMTIMRKVSAPYPLADPCAQIALHSLNESATQLMNNQVNQISQIRDSFCEALIDIPDVTNVVPSVTNFVLVARRIPYPRLSEAIRFTIGTTEEMAMVIKVLKRLS
jgi:histidinol-phosphate aminotransferase